MTVGALPRIHDLRWISTRTPDGNDDRVVPVTQEPLGDALAGRPAPTAIQSLARFMNRIDHPQVEVSARTFDLLQQYEPLQQRVSQLVGHKANTVIGTLASGGAARQRALMARKASQEHTQYSIESAHAAVAYGSGMCAQVNNVLFRASAEMAARRTLGRRPQPGTPMFRNPDYQQMPVYYQHNAGHAYVRIGDLREPRQARDALVGDAWETLPIVKTWGNFVEADLPAWTKMEHLPGQPLSARNALDSFIATARERVSDATVDAALIDDDLEPAGDALIDQVVDQLRASEPDMRGLLHRPTLARQPTLTYRNAETGQVFTPSIGLHDYQQTRLAMADPRFDALLGLTPRSD